MAAATAITMRPIGSKYGATTAARQSGIGTKPMDNKSVVSKLGIGLDRQRSKAANVRMASAYHANNGAPAIRNCGSGSASHRSIVIHSKSHRVLQPMKRGTEWRGS